MLVSQTAFTSLRDAKGLTWFCQICQQFVGCSVVHHRTAGNLDQAIAPICPSAIIWSPTSTILCLKPAIVLEIEQRLQVLCRYQVHGTALTAVSTRWSPSRDILFPSEGYDAITALPSFYINFGLVDKLHKLSVVIFDTPHVVCLDNVDWAFWAIDTKAINLIYPLLNR